MPSCSPTNSRSIPGVRAMSKGCLNFRFGNARTTLNGGGGSGEPTTRDVVHAFRADFPSSACGDWPLDGMSHATRPPISKIGNTKAARDRDMAHSVKVGNSAADDSLRVTETHCNQYRAGVRLTYADLGAPAK